MFFLPLSLPQKEIPGVVVLCPGKRDVSKERLVKITVILEVLLCIWNTWSKPDVVRLSQLGLWHGWNKQFFFLTDSCSPGSLISHHSDRLQWGMLIVSQPEQAGYSRESDAENTPCYSSHCGGYQHQTLPCLSTFPYPKGELQAVSDLAPNF